MKIEIKDSGKATKREKQMVTMLNFILLSKELQENIIDYIFESVQEITDSNDTLNQFLNGWKPTDKSMDKSIDKSEFAYFVGDDKW